MSFLIKAVKSVIGFAVGIVGKVVGAIFGHSVNGKTKKAKSVNNLNKSLEPEAYRKIVFGKTASPLDVRFWQVWGTGGTKFDEVLALASHRINAVKELYFEDKLAIDAAGTVQALYTGVVTRSSVLGTVGQAALSVGGASQYTAAATFDGCAAMVLAWVPDEKKLPNGIPGRYTQIIEGALVYDPRRDSTVTGGSGSHRAADRTTWAYATLDGNGQPIGRNNALQALWYLLGWSIPTKDAAGTVTGEAIVCGRGIDPSDINMATFIAGANNCEVAGYYTDLVLTTEDDHTTNEGKITAQGLIGRLIDPGGLWSYYANVDDTANIAVELTDADILDNVSLNWDEFKGMSEQYNQVVGKFINPSSSTLFQPFPYPMIRDATYENNLGRKVRKTQDFEQVLDGVLAQRLARLMLNSAQYQGELNAGFMARAIKAQAWSVVRYTSERWGWTKLFRVWRHEISTEGGVTMLLKEIHSSIWSAGTVAGIAAPGVGASYDALQAISLTNLAVALFPTTAPDGSKGDGFAISWTAPPKNVRRTELRYKLVGASSWTTAGPVERDITTVVVEPLFSGAQYQIEARHISVNEIPGPWIAFANTYAGTNGNINYTAIAAAGGTAVWSNITGTGKPANNADVTLNNTAAGIVGQAATATSSDFSAVTGGTKPANYATSGDNLLQNSNFMNGTVGWTLTGTAVRTAQAAGDPAPFIRTTGTTGQAYYNTNLPIPAGQRLIFYSYWARQSDLSDYFNHGFNFVDAIGNFLGAVGVSVFSLGYQYNTYPLGLGSAPASGAANQWCLIVGSAQVPIGAVTLAGAQIQTGQTVAGRTMDFTGLTISMVEGSVSRNAKITGIDIGASKSENLVLNSDFADGFNNWVFADAASKTAFSVLAGTASDPSAWKAKAVGLGNFALSANLQNNMPVVGGARIWISGWVRSTTGYANDYGLLRGFFVGVGGYLGSGTGVIGANYGGGTTWTYVTSSVIAPVNATNFIFQPQAVIQSSSTAFVEFAGLRVAYTEPGATLGAAAGTNLFQSNGTTVMTQAEVRTVEGISSGFAGQGALATANSADYKTQITNRPIVTITAATVDENTADLSRWFQIVTGNAWTAVATPSPRFSATGFQCLAGTQSYLRGQDVPVDRDASYLLETWLDRRGGNGGNYLGVTFKDASGAILADAFAGMAYNTGTFSTTTPAEGDPQRIVCPFGAGTGFPIPATAVTMAPDIFINVGAAAGAYAIIDGLRISKLASAPAWSSEYTQDVANEGKKYAITTDTISKCGSVDGWDAAAVTRKAATNIRVSGTPTSKLYTQVIGLSTSNTSYHYNSGYTLSYTQDTEVYVIEFGVGVLNVGYFNVPPKLDIEYDGRTIRYYVNTNLVWTTVIAAGLTMYGCIFGYHRRSGFTEVTVSNATLKDFNAVTGPLKPDNNATVGAIVGGNLRLTDQSIPTQSQIVTSQGTAAGIVGQGSFATVNSVSYGSGFLTGFGAMAARTKVSLGDGFVFRNDGTTGLTDALAVTSLGVSSGFTGQGALAVLASVAYGSAYVTGFGQMAARTKVSLGDGFVFRADGTTGLTDAIAVTSLGTAAAIVGQAATATSSDFAVMTGGTKPENNADVTLLVTGSKSVNVAFDYGGVAKTGSLPIDVNFKLASAAGTDVTTSASWVAVLKSGSATFTPTVGVPNTSGVLNVSVLSADAVIEMQATYSGKVRSGSATFSKVNDPPPVTGSSGGTSSSTSTVSSTTVSTYGAANTSILTGIAGSGGQIACTFPDAFKRGSVGSGSCHGKWQWRVIGGTFADITTEIASTLNANKQGLPDPINDPGNLSVAMTKTGLTNGTSYEFQLLLRSDGAYTINHFGTAAVVGS